MKPHKKRVGRDIPDLSKEEVSEEIGGTDGEKPGDEQGTEGEEGGGGGYGRPREQGDDDQPA